jgi:hypothetical protein
MEYCPKQPRPMNPSQEKALKEHIQAIAKILYEQTSPEQLKDLEAIEATVRQQVTQYVSPELGIFLSKKRQEQALEELEN